MPVYHIPEEYIFPHPDDADPNGLLGIGGDLHPVRLLLAYEHGIFPWFGEHDPVLWWCPDPRFVLFPEKLKVHKSMRSYFNQNKFRVTYDTEFSSVILACSRIKRNGQKGTWITSEMMDAYNTLHELGYAHSIEVWKDHKLVGGLYGIALGKIFFGESMFSIEPNASKFGFISLVRRLIEQNFQLIDCQQETAHLQSLGAELIPRKEFLEILSKNENLHNSNVAWE